MLWLLHGWGLPLVWITGIGGIFILVPVVFWLVFDAYLGPFLFSRGWSPSIEYIPMEKQLVIKDLTGIATIFRPDAQVVIHLESLRAIVISRTLEPQGWNIGLRTRKGEIIPINSTFRSSDEEITQLAGNLSAMIGHPIERGADNGPPQ